ncbi:MAG: hypothetical protein AB2421_18655 [Thermotaleaceae bacterium]
MKNKIADVEGAKSLAKQGFYASMTISGMTTLMIILGALGFDWFDIDFLAFIDVAAFLAIGFGIYKMSRIASVLGLSLYIIERILMMMEYGFKFDFMLIIFCTAFANSIRGTFAYHKLKKLPEAAGVEMVSE